MLATALDFGSSSPQHAGSTAALGMESAAASPWQAPRPLPNFDAEYEQHYRDVEELYTRIVDGDSAAVQRLLPQVGAPDSPPRSTHSSVGACIGALLPQHTVDTVMLCGAGLAVCAGHHRFASRADG